ncbi:MULTISPECIES: hypothetical protein [unclassified Rhizobium]|uniref:hypothetical protein n=1 Tax=unclassified Rhizobium TaxID=2613769 RepID=UPI001042CCDF|nr:MULTISPECIES: hypothetical protein [unclassified Rhizobium]MBB3399641.1 hypothetical protein [Rhizobium sp. BK060]MBB4169488.1 hypothetical protein [Rhizobium sp. BK538]TCM75280.1 hypothetical protein EV291_11414 [Rhizobium sp. BK068]
MEANGATKGHKIGFMNTINEYAMAGGFASRMTTSVGVSPSTTSDPLLQTIEGYRRGTREFAKLPDFSTRQAGIADYDGKEALLPNRLLGWAPSALPRALN